MKTARYDLQMKRSDVDLFNSHYDSLRKYGNWSMFLLDRTQNQASLFSRDKDDVVKVTLITSSDINEVYGALNNLGIHAI